jgi:raffinose/stachyose/melibiose transport system substrate-binding protein
MKIGALKLATSATAVVAVVALAGCGSSSSSTSSSGSSSGGATTITLLVDNAESTVKPAKAVVEAFHAANPDITVQLDTRPQGTDGDNVVKTKLSTGDMADVFWYNSGSLLQALKPEQNLVDLTGDPVLANVDSQFFPAVTQNGKVYGAPQGTTNGGGIIYNKKVYAQLGLSVPKTWADFLANCDKIKAAGITPVIESFKDTWTSQLFVLGDYHNVAVANPTFAADYTANKVKYATDPAAVKGFEKLAEVQQKGYVNKSYGSTTLEQGVKLLTSGKGAQYPILTFVVAPLPAADQQNIGFFGIPGDSAATAGATIWTPGGQYIPKASKHIDAAKKFVAYVASPAGSLAYSKAAPPTGPYMIKGATLPADAPQVAKDIQAYIDAKTTTPALEFLSPVKGPSLEQITVAVGTGQTPAKDGAAQYDKDVTKQAKQLGLAGW